MTENFFQGTDIKLKQTFIEVLFENGNGNFVEKWWR